MSDGGASLRRDLEKGHPWRRALEILAEANGNMSSGIGWHARKMEVSRVALNLMGESADTSDCTLLGREDGFLALWRSLVCLSGIGNGPAANGIVATNVVRSESKHTQKQSYCGATCNVNLKKIITGCNNVYSGLI